MPIRLQLRSIHVTYRTSGVHGCSRRLPDKEAGYTTLKHWIMIERTDLQTISRRERWW